jgi:putative ABC transport system permease protein
LLNVVRTVIAQQLRGEGRTSTQARYQRRMMAGAVVAQFSLAFLLLTGAGLLLRSYIKATETNPGFGTGHLASMRIALPSAVYSKPEQINAFFDRLLGQLAALPSLQQTGAVSDLPMGSTSNRLISVEGRPKGTERVDTIFCSGNALAALRVSLVKGRLLEPGDELRKQRVAVISETLAKRIWKNENAVGQRLKFGVDPKEPWILVVGVVRDVKNAMISTEPRALLFTTSEEWVNEMNVLVRTAGDPLSLGSAIWQRVRRLDPSLPAGKLETVNEVLAESLAPERFRTSLLGSFAAAALLLAMLGIAGLLAYNTSQRTREFGVRIAVGAERRDLLLLVLKQTLQLSGMGIAAGLIASLAATRVLSAALRDQPL